MTITAENIAAGRQAGTILGLRVYKHETQRECVS